MQKALLDYQQTFDVSSSDSSVKSPIALPNLSQRAEQVLLGSLLGDGSLIKKFNTPYYKEAHSLKQKEYLEWKRVILIHILKIKINNKDNRCWSIRSLVNPILNNYYNLFYPNGKKVVTREILDMLEPLGIAVWYCDDGSYSYENNNLNLGTLGFEFEGNLLIQEWFKERYNINWKIYNLDKKRVNYQFMLRVNTDETKKFIKLIKRYVPECMNYKLGLDKNKKYNALKNIRIRKREYHKRVEKCQNKKQHY